MEAMPTHRRDCQWARPIFSIEYEPPHDAANEMVRLYHKALDENSFLLFQYLDASVSLGAPERTLSGNLQNLRNKSKRSSSEDHPNLGRRSVSALGSTPIIHGSVGMNGRF